MKRRALFSNSSGLVSAWIQGVPAHVGVHVGRPWTLSGREGLKVWEVQESRDVTLSRETAQVFSCVCVCVCVINASLGLSNPSVRGFALGPEGEGFDLHLWVCLGEEEGFSFGLNFPTRVLWFTAKSPRVCDPVLPPQGASRDT